MGTQCVQVMATGVGLSLGTLDRSCREHTRGVRGEHAEDVRSNPPMVVQTSTD